MIPAELIGSSDPAVPERVAAALAYIDPGTGGLPYHFLGPLWAWLIAFLALLLTQAKRIWAFSKGCLWKWKEFFRRLFRSS